MVKAQMHLCGAVSGVVLKEMTFKYCLRDVGMPLLLFVLLPQIFLKDTLHTISSFQLTALCDRLLVTKCLKKSSILLLSSSLSPELGALLLCFSV